MRVSGLLLAAGAGHRLGGPKSLLRHGDGSSYLGRAVGLLLDGGCEHVTVVLGAAADQARVVLEEVGGADRVGGVEWVVADRWEEGMGASLRAGLAALAARDTDAALVTLVDLPDIGLDVVARVLGTATPPGAGALVRATYAGRPGHPVLLGRDHWGGVAASARGDHGARDYLAEHPPTRCECGDLASGRDVDRPEDLPGR